MVKKGCDVDALDQNFETPAHFAVKSSKLDNLKYLIEDAGIDIEPRTKNGNSILAEAAKERNLAIVKVSFTLIND